MKRPFPYYCYDIIHEDVNGAAAFAAMKAISPLTTCHFIIGIFMQMAFRTKTERMQRIAMQ